MSPHATRLCDVAEYRPHINLLHFTAYISVSQITYPSCFQNNIFHSSYMAVYASDHYSIYVQLSRVIEKLVWLSCDAGMYAISIWYFPSK